MKREWLFFVPPALVVLVLGTLVADRMLVQRAPARPTALAPEHFATIDVTRIVREQQERTAEVLGRAPGDTDQVQLRERAARFGQALDAAARRLSDDCRCVLLLREAVVAGQVPDLTPRLRELARTE